MLDAIIIHLFMLSFKVAFTVNPIVFYADMLYDSMKVSSFLLNSGHFIYDNLVPLYKGIGTNDKVLIRIMVLRSEIDLQDIKSEFQRKYRKSLETFIRSDCSGDYKRALLCLAGDSNWN